MPHFLWQPLNLFLHMSTLSLLHLPTATAFSVCMVVFFSPAPTLTFDATVAKNITSVDYLGDSSLRNFNRDLGL